VRGALSRRATGADPKNEQARYDTALAIREMSDSLRALGNASGALRNLHGALSLLQAYRPSECWAMFDEERRLGARIHLRAVGATIAMKRRGNSLIV
jgi:hypothetical protein